MYNPEDDINLLDTDSASFNPDNDSPETKLAKLIKQKQMLDLISPKVNPPKIDTEALIAPGLSAPISNNIQQNQQLNNISTGLNAQQLKDLQTSYLDPREHAALDATRKKALIEKPIVDEKTPELSAGKDTSEVPLVLPTDTYSNKLAELQDRANRMASLMDLGRAMSAASATMVGAKESAIDRPLQAMKESIEATPKQFIALKEQEKNDPTSDVSKQYRTIAAKMGFGKETASSSAADIEKMFPQLTNMFTAKEARLARAEAARTLAQERIRAESEKKESKQEQQKNEFIKYGQRALSKEFAKYQKLENAYDSLEQAKKDQVGASDVTILYKFITSLDPDSVVREGEIALGKRGMTLGARIRAATLGQFTGEMLDPKFRADVLKIAGRLKDQGYHSYNETAQVIRDTGKERYNMSDKELGLIDPLLNRELKRKKATGKTVVKKGYNAKTNQTQLIYSDGTKEIVDGRQ